MTRFQISSLSYLSALKPQQGLSNHCKLKINISGHRVQRIISSNLWIRDLNFIISFYRASRTDLQKWISILTLTGWMILTDVNLDAVEAGLKKVRSIIKITSGELVEGHRQCWHTSKGTCPQMVKTLLVSTGVLLFRIIREICYQTTECVTRVYLTVFRLIQRFKGWHRNHLYHISDSMMKVSRAAAYLRGVYMHKQICLSWPVSLITGHKVQPWLHSSSIFKVF